MLGRSAVIFGSKMFSYGMRIVLPFFLVRLLAKADFGAYRQFFLLQTLISTLFQFGLNQGLYYFIPRDENRAGTYFVNTLVMNAVVFGIAFTLLWWRLGAVSDALNMAILRDQFWSLAVYTTVMMFIIAGDCYLLARRRVLTSAGFEIFGQLLTSTLTVLAAFRWRELDSIILALLVGRLTHLLVMMGYIHLKLHGFRVTHLFQDLGPQLRYSLVLGIGGTLGTLLMRFHEVFVSKFYGPEGYAVYSAGCTQFPVLELYMQSLAVVSLGQFALLEKEGDREGIRTLWRKVVTSMYGVGIPFVLLLVIVAGPLIRFLFTDSYSAAVPIFRINSLIKLNFLLNATLVIRALDRNDLTLKTHLTMLLMAPAMFYAGMRLAGPLGIITAHALLYLGGRFFLMWILNRSSGLKLCYVVTLREVLGFYRETMARLRGVIQSRWDGLHA